VKASYLFKQNIKALLRARGQTPHDLAFFCRRSDAWLSKILGKDDRNVPMKYLDKIADFFGIATYQLFQPGISALTERRSRVDRRVVQDRRVSQKMAALRSSEMLSKDDLALLLRIGQLAATDRAEVDQLIREASRSPRRSGGPNTAPAAVAEGSGAEAVSAPRVRRPKAP
jgi:transcriptional regulator with XRE-family HTH domain